MKKKILLSAIFVFSIILLWCTGVNASTYNQRHFDITIPDNSYDVTEHYTDEIKLQTYNGRSYISVSAEENTNDFLCDENFRKILINQFRNNYSDFYLIRSMQLEHNACIGCEIQFKTSGIYTSVYSFKSDNYMYTVMFLSVDKSYLTSSEKEQIFNSFKIKDTVTSSYGLPFTDVSTAAWYRSAVKYAYNNNIIKGLNNYTFAPDDNLTRGMLVTILHRMEGSPYVSGKSKFPDVQDTNEYYYVAVKWATQNNIVSGYHNGKFGPNDPITREQLAVMLNSYCKYKGKYKASNTNAGDLNKFSDGAKVSDYAIYGMKWAVGSGVITGSKGRLNPQGTATRAEVASMLYKYSLNIK